MCRIMKIWTTALLSLWNFDLWIHDGEGVVFFLCLFFRLCGLSSFLGVLFNLGIFCKGASVRLVSFCCRWCFSWCFVAWSFLVILELLGCFGLGRLFLLVL